MTAISYIDIPCFFFFFFFKDGLGSNILLAFPQWVVHKLDMWSPLMPTNDKTAASSVYHYPDILSRSIDEGNLLELSIFC